MRNFKFKFKANYGYEQLFCFYELLGGFVLVFCFGLVLALCAPHVCLVLTHFFWLQKRAQDLVLELWIIVSCHVGAENRTLVLCRGDE